MMVDSLNMNDADRNIIAEKCCLTGNDKILITHGTDTMVETAKIIAERKLTKRLS